LGIGSEWAAVFAMVFVFIVGFLMGALTVYVCSLRTKVRHQRTPLEVAEQRHAPLVAADRRLDRERIHALGNRTPIPDAFTVTKTGYDFHQTGCQYLNVGVSARTNKTYQRCTVCFPVARRDE
jgi:hypothetical protein